LQWNDRRKHRCNAKPDYLAARADVRFAHGICPGCYEQVMGEAPAPLP
jgi:hypothetical protein